jgi:hypothetical protein
MERMLGIPSLSDLLGGSENNLTSTAILPALNPDETEVLLTNDDGINSVGSGPPTRRLHR